MRDAVGRVQTVLLVGGTSAIGRAIAADLIRAGADRIVLAGRDVDRMSTAAQQLQGDSPGPASISLLRYAIEDGPEAAAALMAHAAAEVGDLDVVVLCIGALPDQDALDHDLEATDSTLQVNFIGPAILAQAAACLLRRQGHGCLVVLSSAAAIRPRRSILAYSAAKAGLDAFASELGESLRGSGARVLVVRPGHVRTPMTAGLPTPPLTSDPQDVAVAVSHGLRRKAPVVWVPAVMHPVMSALHSLPRPLFRRLGL